MVICRQNTQLRMGTFAFFVVLCSLSLSAADTAISYQAVNRKISADSHILRYETEITIEPRESSLMYTYYVDKEMADSLAYIGAQVI